MWSTIVYLLVCRQGPLPGVGAFSSVDITSGILSGRRSLPLSVTASHKQDETLLGVIAPAQPLLSFKHLFPQKHNSTFWVYSESSETHINVSCSANGRPDHVKQ